MLEISSSHIVILIIFKYKKYSNISSSSTSTRTKYFNTNWKDVSMSQQTGSDTKSGQDNLVGTRHMHMDLPYLIQANNNLDSLLITFNNEHITEIK